MRLDDFTLIHHLFIQSEGVDKKWLRALALGDSNFFDDYNTLVNHYIDNGVCVINSITTNNMFGRAALRHLKQLIESNESIIIASSVATIAEHLAKKYNLSYNYDKQFYYRGIRWVE